MVHLLHLQNRNGLDVKQERTMQVERQCVEVVASAASRIQNFCLFKSFVYFLATIYFYVHYTTIGASLSEPHSNYYDQIRFQKQYRALAVRYVQYVFECGTESRPYCLTTWTRYVPKNQRPDMKSGNYGC